MCNEGRLWQLVRTGSELELLSCFQECFRLAFACTVLLLKAVAYSGYMQTKDGAPGAVKN